MSFVLPGNARELRFTGEVTARPPAKTGGPSAHALGKPRVRKPPPPVPAPRVAVPARAARVQTPMPAATPHVHVPTPPPSRSLPTLASRDVYRNDLARPPYVEVFDAPSVRRKLESLDDENPTMAMERDALDVLPGGHVLRAPKRSPAVAAPIPHFRAAPVPASEPKMIIIPGTASSRVKRTTSGAPLAIWLLAAVVAGIVSYFVAPEVVARLESPAHTVSDR